MPGGAKVRSRENASIDAYLSASGLEYVITSTTEGTHSAGSYHGREGTGSRGLATDIARAPGVGNDRSLIRLFDAFKPVEHELAELICSWSLHGIKDGKRVDTHSFFGAKVYKAHFDHVHVALPKGTFIHWPQAAPPAEDDMAPYFQAPCPTGGYWIVQRSDGGVFAYDAAPFLGSLPSLNVHPAGPIISFTPVVKDGQVIGYYLQGADGGLFAFGQATPLESYAGHPELHKGSRTFIGVDLDADLRGATQIAVTNGSGTPKTNLYHWRSG